MVRPRRLPTVQNRSDGTSSSGSNDSTVGDKKYRIITHWKSIFGFISLIVAGYTIYLGYLETRVNTPFVDVKVVQESGLSVPDRYWGSYRPGVYFGLKTREPQSPVFGLMWYELSEKHKGIRHLCDQGDNLATYGWLRHDGVSFGEQMIVDSTYEISTSFIKFPGGDKGGHWTARVNVTSKVNDKSPFALVWYAALDEASTPPAQYALWVQSGAIMGHTPELGDFKINLIAHKGRIKHKAFWKGHSPGLHLLKETFTTLLQNTGEEQEKKVNFVPIQMIVEPPFVLDVIYSTEDVNIPSLKGEEHSRVLEDRRKSFDESFEKKFRLSDKNYPEDDVGIAKAALSNMVGGIGYFYGASKVKSQYTKKPVPYWKAALYTAVPSRSFFPRGFLWDEGFHGLLIGRWSPEIQLDIASHWLDLMNVEGWIPREQILGSEALARVPAEFVVQSNAAANPPMLLIQLAALVEAQPHLFAEGGALRSTLDRMFSRLQVWYQWFQHTQKGEIPTSYRWRGRVDDGVQLNPKTLTSGLDDYPRASHPSEIERHVDLRCWMYAAADAMVTIAEILNRDSTRFEATRVQLSNEDLLNELHWSHTSQTYSDYGVHTDGVRLVRRKPQEPRAPPVVVREVTAPPKPRLVTSAFGYVSLFPMLLKVLKPNSPKLGKILEDLDKPELLWSPYGLRSLSKTSPMYMKRNTEHDPPYWRGQVWLNINYLALRALRYYSKLGADSNETPYAQRAKFLHDRLAHNLISNVLSEYKRTGYLWEQYSGEDGSGSGCRPFTGWTALITLIMAEEY